MSEPSRPARSPPLVQRDIIVVLQLIDISPARDKAHPANKQF